MQAGDTELPTTPTPTSEVATAPGVSVAETKPRQPSGCSRRIPTMVSLANPRGNHILHLALLGTFLVFNFLTLVIGAAFIDEGRHWYYGEPSYIWEACLLHVSDIWFRILLPRIWLDSGE